jgi:polyketide cyclase/dehydrase/lipid transport protein
VTTGGYLRLVKPTISRSVRIAAAPRAVWAMVTDLPRMGDLSPENVGGRWIDGSTGPALGARFRGVNRNGHREWWTHVLVIECEPERRFTFDVRSPIGVRVSRWSYEITPTDDGCVLTEHWYRVGSWFVRRFLGPRVTGRADRPGYNVTSIEHTLAKVKAHFDARSAAA